MVLFTLCKCAVSFLALFPYSLRIPRIPDCEEYTALALLAPSLPTIKRSNYAQRREIHGRGVGGGVEK